MRACILIILVAIAVTAVSARGIHQHNDVRRFLGLPSISDIKEKLTGTLEKVKDKILDALLELRGDVAFVTIKAFLRVRPYIDKLKIIFDEIRRIAEATEHDWAKERELLLVHVKELFDIFLAEEEVQALMQNVQELIDSARETAKSSKEKAQDILKKLGDLVFGAIISDGSSKRSIDSYEMNDHMEVKRFLGLPSISDITGRIKEKLTETLDKVQNKILQAILAGGDIATGVLETVLQGQKTLLPYADKLRTILADIRNVAEATENAWAEQRARLLAHIKEIFDMILAEDEVQAVMQKVQEMVDSARETAKSSKEKAQEILKDLRVLVWGGLMSAGSSMDLLLELVGKRSIDSEQMNYHMEVKRFLGFPSISDIAGRIKDKLKETLDKVQAKILETILAGGDIAAGVLETVLQGEKKLLPYVDKVRAVLAEIRGVAEATEAKWAEQRQRLLEHIKEIFDMILAEEEVQALMQKVKEMVDSARETVKSSKEKAQDILTGLRVLVLGGIMGAGSTVDLILGKRDLEYYDINDEMKVKRFLGFPSISDIAGRIKDKLKETLDKVQAKILETILAGGDIAAGVLETVLQGEKKLLPYVDKVRAVLAEIRGVAEATEAKWAEQRQRLLEHIKEIFDMILAEDEVQALMQKVKDMVDSARETVKSSKEKAQDILTGLRVLVLGGIMGAGSTVDLILGKRDLEYYDINDEMMMKRFLGLPSISEIYGSIKDRIIARILAGGEIAYDLLERILQNEKIKPYAEKLRTIIYEIKEVASASEHEWGKLRQSLLQHVKDLFDMFMSEEKVQAVVAKVAAAIDKAREVAQSSTDSAKAILNKVTTYIWAGVLAVGAPIDLVVGKIAGKIFDTVMG